MTAEIEKHSTRLDAAVASLQRVQANLKRYRAAVLKAACEGRLVPTEAELARAEGRGYETATEMLACLTGKTRQPLATRDAFPDGWDWANLSELKQFSFYGPRFTSDSYSYSGKLVVRTSDISEGGKVNVHTAPKLPLSEEEFSKYRLERGELVFTRTGSLGTLAVFNDDAEAIPGAYLIQYRLRVPIESTWYIFYFFRSPKGQRQLVKGGAGVGRPNLNAPTIEAIEIPFPPLAEQIRITREIERRLSIIDSLEAAVDANLKKADGLRRSVLRFAFSGGLVPQDSNDEPASVLLERIRQGKVVQPAVPGARKARTKPMLAPPPSLPRSVRAEGPAPVKEPEPEPEEADFLQLPRDEQVDIAWETLFGQGMLDKDVAIRTVADELRSLDLARFKRLRQDGPLYGAIAAAIERGVREGSFDRPRRGCVRAVLPDPKEYEIEDWQRCLLAVTGPGPADIDVTLRAAAEWAREALGLEYARLREDGVILTGLREALEEAVQAGGLVRRGGRVRRG